MDQELEELVARVESAGGEWVKGSAAGFAAQMSRSDDFSIMGPFGGPPMLGWQGYSAIAPRVAAQFQGGSSRIEVVSAHRSGDLAVLVQIEHQRVQFAGDTAPQDWNLRVTQVFRREEGEWRIVHRHADPLLAMRNFEDAKALARAEGAAFP